MSATENQHLVGNGSDQGCCGWMCCFPCRWCMGLCRAYLCPGQGCMCCCPCGDNPCRGNQCSPEQGQVTQPQVNQPVAAEPRRNLMPSLDFCVQFRTTGNMGGYEEKFLKQVKKRLPWHAVSLKHKVFTEASKDPLLLFCPIASRMGTDIENALQGLSGEQKVLLVVMHFLPKENTGAFVDTRWQASHHAVVRTVHTCYTLQDGFYPCEMNKAAVADVADAIKGLAKNH